MPLVTIRHLSKSFPGVRALDDYQFELLAGKVHALMGENGAGKSTFMKILAGVYQKDSGEVRLDGRKSTFRAPEPHRPWVIGIIHQELNLINHLSVA